MAKESYCGCCGRESWPWSWCQDCQEHLRPAYGLAPWLRTYWAQFKEDCPYQVAALEAAISAHRSPARATKNGTA